jgi:hypothetical protein
MEDAPVSLRTILREVPWRARVRLLARLLRGRRDVVLLVAPTDEEVAAAAARDAEDRRLGDVVAPPAARPYTCPCCGHPTLVERGTYDWCPECGWEDDGQDDHDSHVARRGGPNGGISLDEARARYVASGRARGHHVPPAPPRGGVG